MDYKKSVFSVRPQLVEMEGKEVRVNFDTVAETVSVSTGEGDSEESAEQQEVYEAYVVRVEQPLGYDKVVSAIVSAAYPSDKMQAIINNHLLDSEDDDDYEAHTEEFEAMQQWRKHAKEVAREVIAAMV